MRPIPIPRLAWTTTDGVPSLDDRVVYKRIARWLVLEKYPAWLHQIPSVDAVWPDGLQALRTRKAEALFFSNTDKGWHHDPRRWCAFVDRVAGYLAFVDRRRGRAAGLRELYAELPPVRAAALLERDFVRAEREGLALLEYAADLSAEAARRRVARKGPG